LAQPDFALALLGRCKAAGLHTCVETSGFAAPEVLRRFAPLVDLFLFDLKITDAADHERYTGVAMSRIHENLFSLDAQGATTILRCPIIPGINDNEAHFARIGQIALGLRFARAIELEPYHPFGLNKARAIGKTQRYTEDALPAQDTVRRWISRIQSHTDKAVISG
jgi:pyruvate formate lyase activating enzyme